MTIRFSIVAGSAALAFSMISTTTWCQTSASPPPAPGAKSSDLEEIVVTAERREEQSSKVPITIAVMGCVVNGPAEARHADIGVTGGRGKGVIFKKGKLYRTVPQEELLPVLLAEIDAIAAEALLPR